MYKILIVEDDEVIASAIARRLEAWGYEARCVKNFKSVMHDFAEYAPQLVLLDISLPFFNGYHWCSEIRKVSKVPVMFISSAGDNMNIVMAVNMGGDDFLTKPFDMDVLLAKIAALLRRTYDFAASAGVMDLSGALLSVGDATLTYNGERIELSRNEFRILQVLGENRGQVVSRDTLMAKLWETDSFIDDNTLTVNVTRLRKKLEEAGLSGLIKTKKGMGYMVE